MVINMYNIKKLFISELYCPWVAPGGFGVPDGSKRPPDIFRQFCVVPDGRPPDIFGRFWVVLDGLQMTPVALHALGGSEQHSGGLLVVPGSPDSF